jgi:hypothetical protein
MRIPSWNAARERRSPPSRGPRYRTRVNPPSARPITFGGPASNGASQTSVRPSRSSRSRSPFDPTSTGLDLSSRRSLTNSPQQYQWNGSPSPNANQRGATTSSSPSGPMLDAYGFPFQSQMHVPPDDFYPGLDSPNPDVPPANEQSSGLPEMSTDLLRFSSSTTEMFSGNTGNSSHVTHNQFTSYQQL